MNIAELHITTQDLEHGEVQTSQGRNMEGYEYFRVQTCQCMNMLIYKQQGPEACRWDEGPHCTLQEPARPEILVVYNF